MRNAEEGGYYSQIPSKQRWNWSFAWTEIFDKSPVIAYKRSLSIRLWQIGILRETCVGSRTVLKVKDFKSSHLRLVGTEAIVRLTTYIYRRLSITDNHCFLVFCGSDLIAKVIAVQRPFHIDLIEDKQKLRLNEL